MSKIHRSPATTLLPNAEVVGIQSIQQRVNVTTKTFLQNGDNQLARHEKDSWQHVFEVKENCTAFWREQQPLKAKKAHSLLFAEGTASL